MTRSQHNYGQKLKEWTDAGFNSEWLTKLAEEPASSDTCGLHGIAATSVLRILEGYGGIRRGKIQKNHKRIWAPGPHHNKWIKAAKIISETANASVASA